MSHAAPRALGSCTVQLTTPNIQTSSHLYCESPGCSGLFTLILLCFVGGFLRILQPVPCVFLNLKIVAADRIKQLSVEVAKHVQRIKEYYYQYNYDRLCVCKLTLHALLHVADDVSRCGPVWVFWSFLTERYCRKITACATSYVVPYLAIREFGLRLSRLSTVAIHFAPLRKGLLFGQGDAPVDVSRMECVYED
ncbi:hypothetical protein FRC12_000901 [Ceratobasidium sp. 428]|nr:hypothetical protein FRC12_000901 [Ceratobasidium sp. 428]